MGASLSRAPRPAAGPFARPSTFRRPRFHPSGTTFAPNGATFAPTGAPATARPLRFPPPVPVDLRDVVMRR